MQASLTLDVDETRLVERWLGCLSVSGGWQNIVASPPNLEIYFQTDLNLTSPSNFLPRFEDVK